jgi:hypothetical protein
MFREMITLPIRVAACATHLGVRVTARAGAVAFGLTRRLIAGSVPTDSHGTAANARESSSTFGLGVVIASAPPPPEAAPAAAPAPARVAPEANPTAPSETQAAPAPEAGAAPEIPSAHVSEGLHFVEAFAEPGAEEGAGAEVHVKEPWRGYSPMTANQVIVRLADASPEELAAVVLYEGIHRRRKTVLEQARRLLGSATVAGPAAQARRA